VTVQNNTVSGYSQSNPATGGGIFSTGTLTVENCRIQNNRAIGGRGDRFMDGGTGSGGGLYVSAGTALLTNVTLSANIAQGGAGGDGSNYHHAGEGGKTPGGNGGNGLGGGLCIESHALLWLDAFTATNAKRNKADVDPNIHGPYTVG
jgi:hypothetical protein